jgi:hypothetical protein
VVDFGKNNKINMNIIISGPLRPSISQFLHNLENIRSNFTDCKIYLSTWKSYKSGGTMNREDDPTLEINNDEIRLLQKKVDCLLLLDEPTIEEIDNIVYVKTKQQSALPSDHAFNILAKYNIYKMFFGIKKIIDFIDENNLISSDEIVVRYRTDLHLNININEIIDIDKYYLIDRKSSGVSFDDWFGISKYENIKKIWYFENIEEYNKYVLASWNAEEIVKNKVINNNIDYKYLESCSDVYLLRNEKVWGYDKYF